MKYCVQCGNQMNDSDVFCMYCGKKSMPMNPPSPEADANIQPMQTEEDALMVEEESLYAHTIYEYTDHDPYLAEERRFIDSYVGTLNTEQKIWFIFGIIFLCLGALMAFIAAFKWIDISAGEDVSFETLMSFSYSIAFAIAYIPIGIVDVVLSGSKRKVNYVIYSDIAPASQKAGSVGNIVLGALFNNIALVFAIINFVRTKTNKEMIDRVSARQHATAQIRENNAQQ